MNKVKHPKKNISNTLFRLIKTRECLNECGKQKLLHALRLYKEIQEPMWISETEMMDKSERNAVAKTFDTKADFDNYVKMRRGIEITPKEQQALVMELAQDQTLSSNGTIEQPPEDEITVDDQIRVTKSITFVDETEGADVLSDLLLKLDLKSVKPVEKNTFFIKYESTDNFGTNQTTIIKKLREGDQFCWTAFSKYERAEEEGNPEEPAKDSEPIGGKDKKDMGKDELPDLEDLK